MLAAGSNQFAAQAACTLARLFQRQALLGMLGFRMRWRGRPPRQETLDKMSQRIEARPAVPGLDVEFRVLTYPRGFGADQFFPGHRFELIETFRSCRKVDGKG